MSEKRRPKKVVKKKAGEEKREGPVKKKTPTPEPKPGPKKAVKGEKVEDEDEQDDEKEEEGEGEEEKKEGAEGEEVAEYVVKPKPKLTKEMKQALRQRNEMNTKRPEFHRQEWFRYKKLGDSWRRPRGMSSKLRRHFKYRPNVVSIGYRGPKAARGLHPSGFEEVMVHNIKDLEKVDPKTQAVRIGHKVGSRKRKAIMEKVEELGKKKKTEYRILNPLKK